MNPAKLKEEAKPVRFVLFLFFTQSGADETSKVSALFVRE
jgi:hypothetical protein